MGLAQPGRLCNNCFVLLLAVVVGTYCKREVKLGRAGWGELKTMYKPQKPGKQANQKKRKEEVGSSGLDAGGLWTCW
jgi:hypothetical protein